MFNKLTAKTSPALLCLSLGLFTNAASASFIYEDDLSSSYVVNTSVDTLGSNMAYENVYFVYEFSLSSDTGYTGLVDVELDYSLDLLTESFGTSTMDDSTIEYFLFEDGGDDIVSYQDNYFSDIKLDTTYWFEIDANLYVTSLSSDVENDYTSTALQINFNGVGSVNGEQAIKASSATVPTPAMPAIFALGLLGFVGYRKRSV